MIYSSRSDTHVCRSFSFYNDYLAVMRFYVTIKLLIVELFSTRMAQVRLVDVVCQTAVKQHLIDYWHRMIQKVYSWTSCCWNSVWNWICLWRFTLKPPYSQRFHSYFPMQITLHWLSGCSTSCRRQGCSVMLMSLPDLFCSNQTMMQNRV